MSMTQTIFSNTILAFILRKNLCDHITLYTEQFKAETHLHETLFHYELL